MVNKNCPNYDYGDTAPREYGPFCKIKKESIDNSNFCDGCVNAVKKPPLGIRPKFVVRHERKKEIIDAVIRYVNDNRQIPEEWIKEYNELIEEDKNDTQR